MDKGQFGWAYIWGAYIRKENTSICNLLNLLFFFFPVKSTYFGIFHVNINNKDIRIRTFKDKVKNKDTRIPQVKDKVKNKDTVDVDVASLLLTLNTFQFLLQCFFC